jgi:hypothetical protein
MAALLAVAAAAFCWAAIVVSVRSTRTFTAARRVPRHPTQGERVK